MKSSFLTLLVGATLLLSFDRADAKTFGGFAVGDSFELKVTKVTSTKQTGIAGTPVANPIPSNVPKYAKNKEIRFRIGAGGKLVSKGLSIPFAHASRTVNEYNLSKPGTVTVTHTAEIDKGKSGATGGTLYFFISDNSGMDPVYYTVVYTLK